jgi:small GTP-binding protein
MISFTYKILVAGNGGVGKTTLIHKYITGEYSLDTKMTIGIDFQVHHLNINGVIVSLQLWDFGGEDRFRCLIPAYCIGARGALLVCDLTRYSSLDDIEDWINLMRKSDRNLLILLLGNKVDLEESIQIEDDVLEEIVKKFELFGFLKTSSKTGINVNESFSSLSEKIYNDDY